MQVGDYQISNLLIGAVLLTTVAGLGIATGAAGSVADVVSDTFIPGGNATQAPDTDSDSSETDQNTDTTDSQDTDDGGGSSDSTDSTGSSGSSDSGGSSDSDSDSTDSTSTQDSGTEDQQDSQQQDNQQQDNQQQDNQQQDNQQDDGNIQTSASITSPSNGQIYNTASVDIAATVEAANASYEVRLDDSLKQSGQLDGTKDISSTLSVSDGTHNIKVMVKRSGETLVSKEAQFSVSTSSTNTSGSASISLFDPSSKTYSTNTVPLSASLDASDASYQVNVDGVTKTSGSVDGSKTLDQNLNIVSGSHNMEVMISDSTGTLASDSVSFTVDAGDTGTQRTGFYSPDNLTAGGTALVRLYNDQGGSVEGATVTVGSLGDFTTNQFGEIEFQVPFQDTITASSTNYEKTFDITQTASEPDITLVSPVDTESFDTPTGTNKDVTFEADVDITEDSGTASLIIDGSQAYTQDLSSGTNSLSTTQSLSGGTHNWQIDVDTPEYDVSSSSRSLTVNEVEVQNGLSLQNNATAGEFNYVRLYSSGEPVEGTQITVNGDSIGTTDSNGEVGFEVPNVQEITISPSGYSDITRTVEGYTEEIDMSFSFSNAIYQGRSNTLTVTDQGSGDALNDATVYANGVEQGQTDSSGQITFTVPEENSLTVKAIKDNSDDNQTFTADLPPIDITWFGPDGSINDYKTTFDFSLDLQESATATLDVEGQQQLQQSLSSGTHSITEQVKFENSGTRDYTLTVDSSSETRTETGSFTTEQDMPPIDITINSPTSGETINDYKTAIEYGFDSPEPFSYNLVVDGRELTSDQVSEDFTSTVTDVNCLNQGQSNLQITATGEDTGSTFSNEINFETTSNQPIGDIEIISPVQGEKYPFRDIRVESNACESLNQEIVLKGINNDYEEVLNSASLSSYEENFFADQSPGFGAPDGEYALNVTMESGTTNKSKQVEFTADSDASPP